jgi:hypothetical protein
VSPDTPQAVPGFDSAEKTFSNRRELGFFRRMIPTMVIYLAMGLILGLFLGALMMPLGLGGLRWLLVPVLALAFAASVYRIEKKSLTATWSGSTLQLSPFGAVASDRYARLELPWSGLREVGRGTVIDPLTLPIVAERPGGIAHAVAMVSASMKEERLIGEGSLSVSPDAPRRVRRQVKQDDQFRQPRAIVLTHYDPRWRSGRIGQWIRAYRPDLMS